jgi:hypothetical protein
MVTCTKIKRGWFKDKITLKADEHESIIFDSFCGERRFYVNNGSSIKTYAKKSAEIKIGDSKPLKEWLLGSAECDPFNFPWDWE